MSVGFLAAVFFTDMKQQFFELSEQKTFFFFFWSSLAIQYLFFFTKKIACLIFKTIKVKRVEMQ